MKRKRREDYQPCTVPFRGDILDWARLIVSAAFDVRDEKLKAKPKHN